MVITSRVGWDSEACFLLPPLPQEPPERLLGPYGVSVLRFYSTLELGAMLVIPLWDSKL